MAKNKEKYRVKPGLSLTSKDLYRRYRNNSLNINNSGNQYGMDIAVQEFTRMDKTQQLNSFKESFNQLQNLKNAQLRQNQRSNTQPGEGREG